MTVVLPDASSAPIADPPPASSTHLVMIPSYNPGPKVYDTVREARRYWNPVWVVIDGSTDGSEVKLKAMAEADSGLFVVHLPENQGKGAAVLHGCQLALERGFTHVLTMDSDGQHPEQLIPQFMQASIANPGAMVLGQPVFDITAPRIRVMGRKLSNMWVHLETLWAGIGDSLFGFRIYPVAALVDVMQHHRWMRRFDFDPEAVVRLSWYGTRALNLPAPVRYFRVEEDGVSHFNYLRDNILLSWMHLRLIVEFLLRLPFLLVRRLCGLLRAG